MQRNSFSHRLSVVEHTGHRVNIQNLLRRDRHLRKGGKPGLGEKNVKVGRGWSPRQSFLKLFIAKQIPESIFRIFSSVTDMSAKEANLSEEKASKFVMGGSLGLLKRLIRYSLM